MSLRNPMWVVHATRWLFAPLSGVLVYGMMIPSHGEYQVA